MSPSMMSHHPGTPCASWHRSLASTNLPWLSRSMMILFLDSCSWMRMTCTYKQYHCSVSGTQARPKESRSRSKSSRDWAKPDPKREPHQQGLRR